MGFALALQLVLIFIQKKALAHKNKAQPMGGRKGKKIRNTKKLVSSKHFIVINISAWPNFFCIQKK
jgi:hypothetical protein